MTNKIRCALATLALIVSGAASANTVNWGPISAPDTRDLYNTFNIFDGSGSFHDDYNFSLSSLVNSFGGIVVVDPLLNWTDLDVFSVKLYKGATLVGSDNSIGSFNFSNLGAGNYTLRVDGEIDQHLALTFQDSYYDGSISFTTGTTAVPEPSTLLLAGIGLLGVAFAMRRRLFN